MRIKTEEILSLRANSIKTIVLDPGFLLIISLIYWLCIFFLPLKFGFLGIYSAYFPFFPVFLFIVSCLLIASFFNEFKSQFVDSHYLRPLVYVSFVAFLYLTPALFEGGVRFYANYKYLSNTLFLFGGNIDSSYFWTHNWPGAFMLYNVIISFIGVDQVFVLLQFFPFIIELLSLYSLIFLSEELNLSLKQEQMVIFLFLIGNWTSEDYFCSQSIAYILFLFFIVFYNQFYQREEIHDRETVKIISLYLLLILTLLITHLLTAIVVLIPVIILIKRLYKSNPLISLLIFTFIMISAGFVFLFSASGYSTYQRVLNLLNSLGNIGYLIQRNLLFRAVGTPSHLSVVYIRVFFSLILLIISVVPVVVMMRDRSLQVDKIKPWFIYLCLLVLLLFLGPYGGELFIRLFLFGLPLLALLFSLSIVPLTNTGTSKQQKISYLLIISIMVFGPQLHYIAHYGDDGVDYISPAELAGYDLVLEDNSPKFIIGGFVRWDYSNHPNNRIFSLGIAEWNGTVALPYPNTENTTQYILIGKLDELSYVRSGVKNNLTEFWADTLTKSNNYIQIFDSLDMKIFKHI